MSREPLFRDRAAAGEKLAERLLEIHMKTPWKDPVIVALPRGGLPVADAIARRLNAPLEILVVRKITPPGNPEYGIGAVTEGGLYWINDDAVVALGLEPDDVREQTQKNFAEVVRKVQLYRGGRPIRNIKDRSVIVVDDGFATGVSAAVATQYFKSHGAREVILAAPVGSPECRRFLSAQADEVICLKFPENFTNVGEWYEEFHQLRDHEVFELLKRDKAA